MQLLTSMLMMMLLACNKKSDAALAETDLSISQSILAFSEKDSLQSVQVITNVADFEVSISPGSPWCSFKKNGTTVSILVSSMGSLFSQRSTAVKIIAGSGIKRVEKTISVTQSRVWKLLWEDNFNSDGLVNSANWTLQGKGSSDWKMYMTPTDELAFVKGGNLILRARKSSTGYETSGVASLNKFSFKYGKVEVRAKLSAGQGTWPAIWMMPAQSIYGAWPKSGEIDIMEHLNNDTKIYQVVHSHYVDNLGMKTDPLYSFTPSFVVGGYNTYGIEWFPDKIDFLVNGIITFSYPKKASVPPDQLQWPFDQPFYLILNQALGGSWVGKIDDSILPAQSEIDYVKVFGLSFY